MEIWKNIPGLQGYKVSDLGRIRCISGFRKLQCSDNGYAVFTAGKPVKRYKVHRLVAQMFIPNPQNKPEVNHKDGNKLNNCVTNLEWVTRSENRIHAWNSGLMSRRFTCNELQKYQDHLKYNSVDELISYLRSLPLIKNRRF